MLREELAQVRQRLEVVEQAQGNGMVALAQAHDNLPANEPAGWGTPGREVVVEQNSEDTNLPSDAPNWAR